MLFLPPKITGLVGATLLLSAYSISAQSTTETEPSDEAKIETPIVESETTVDDVTAETVIAAITGDVKKGKKVFKKCKACHKVKEGKNGAGPSLYKVIGRDAAQVDGFKYSTAMTESGLTWDVATLTEYLKGPKKLVPKTSMSFSGLKKDQDIENVIAYLDDASNQE